MSIYLGEGIFAVAVLLISLVPIFRFQGTPANIIGMISMLFAGGNGITGGMRIFIGVFWAFIAFLAVTSVQEMIGLFTDRKKSPFLIFIYPFVLGVALLASLVICWLFGSAIDATLALKIIAPLVTLIGFYFFSNFE